MKPHRKPLHRQRGISLIELMVGMTLGLLLLTALATLYASTSQSRVQLGNTCLLYTSDAADEHRDV